MSDITNVSESKEPEDERPTGFNVFPIPDLERFDNFDAQTAVLPPLPETDDEVPPPVDINAPTGDFDFFSGEPIIENRNNDIFQIPNAPVNTFSQFGQEERLLLQSYSELQQQKINVSRRLKEIGPKVKKIVAQSFPEGLLCTNGYQVSVQSRTRNAPCNFQHVFQSVGEFMLLKGFYDSEPLSRLFAQQMTSFIFQKLEKAVTFECLSFRKPTKKRVLVDKTIPKQKNSKTTTAATATPGGSRKKKVSGVENQGSILPGDLADVSSSSNGNHKRRKTDKTRSSFVLSNNHISADGTPNTPNTPKTPSTPLQQLSIQSPATLILSQPFEVPAGGYQGYGDYRDSNSIVEQDEGNGDNDNDDNDEDEDGDGGYVAGSSDDVPRGRGAASGLIGTPGSTTESDGQGMVSDLGSMGRKLFDMASTRMETEFKQFNEGFESSNLPI